MPSFNLLPDDEVAALVEYVKYLSIAARRKSADRAMAKWARRLEDWPKGPASGARRPKHWSAKPTMRARRCDADIVLAEAARSGTGVSASTSAKARPSPKSTPSGQGHRGRRFSPPSVGDEPRNWTSIAKGRELFYTKANCIKCHGPSELGDGQTTDYDDWTKPLVEMAKQVEDARKSIAADTDLTRPSGREQLAAVNAKARALEYDALPPRSRLPRNLRLGIYRGGRRPLDLYRRMHAGINGTPMPEPVRHAGQSSPNEIWQSGRLRPLVAVRVDQPAAAKARAEQR